MPIRTFEVYRVEDTTGVSGQGKIIEGCVFSDGECIIRWVSEVSPGHSTSIFHSFGSFMSIHVAPHPDNKTRVVFSDGEVFLHTEKVESATPKSKRSRKQKVETRKFG